ncbi:hypothetical protein Tco_1134204 [Tanacetum coccineum]
MDECVSMSTPMATERLDADLQGTLTDQTTYHQMIGGLMYLIASRPDIDFATFICDRYQARPMVKHLKEVKWIFQYLRQSYNMGLWYPKDSRFELIAYLDADHAGCKDDCKRTLVEYVSLSACCAQVIWMRTQLLDYGYKYNRIPMYCDSKSAIAISCNPVQHSRTKHIDIWTIFHFPQATDNNHDHFVPAPKFFEMVPFYINNLGFTLELRSTSNFKTTDLLQPWQTLCKMFSRCLTTCVTDPGILNRTTSAPRTPNPEIDEGESSAPQRSTVIRLRIPQRRSTRLTPPTPPTPITTTDEADDLVLQVTLRGRVEKS